jgi:hypothetical protein
MTGKTNSEILDSGPQETAPELAKAPATEPSGETAASEPIREEKSLESQEPTSQALATNTPAAPASPTATKPAPPNEGD